jgi:hypothetical protein
MKPATSIKTLMLPDGTVVTADANGNFTVDASYSTILLNAGWLPVNMELSFPENQFKSVAVDGNNSNNATVSIGAANVAGAKECVFKHSGNQAANWTDQIPAAANIIAAVPGWQVGQSYKLRVINASNTANRTLTIAAANNNVTLTGTMTLETGTFRDFIVSYTAANAVTLQEIGAGDES